jgi:uncharacterized LabA/DUF88 family protein
MSANVYIDGFNLYYGSLRNTKLKWLDLAALVSALFPRTTVGRLRYFTARVKSTVHDSHAPVRQATCLRALRTIPNVTIHEGRFAFRKVLLPQFPFAYRDSSRPPQAVQVMKAEEKRSDVNLATHLLVDCYTNDCDEAIVISNDSDIALPVEMVVKQCGIAVHVVNPHEPRKLSRELTAVASSFLRSINKTVLASSQFPNTLSDANGAFTKPPLW